MKPKEKEKWWSQNLRQEKIKSIQKKKTSSVQGIPFLQFGNSFVICPFLHKPKTWFDSGNQIRTK